MGNVRSPQSELVITPLTAENADALTEMLASQSDTYTQFFIPFPFEKSHIEPMLASATLDRYWGVWCDDELAGFFMLRGFDEGYARPSFGILISEAFSNRGLSKLSLTFALSWCKLNSVEKVMLKVAADNVYAKRTYEKLGFQFVELCNRTGHHMMEAAL